MAEARKRETWNHTSHILWCLAEPNRDKKKRSTPFKPADFNPYMRKYADKPLGKISVKFLKRFVKGGGSTN